MMGFNIHDLKIISFINFAFLQSHSSHIKVITFRRGFMRTFITTVRMMMMMMVSLHVWFGRVLPWCSPMRTQFCILRTGLAAVLSANANKLGQKVVSHTHQPQTFKLVSIQMDEKKMAVRFPRRRKTKAISSSSSFFLLLRWETERINSHLEQHQKNIMFVMLAGIFVLHQPTSSNPTWWFIGLRTRNYDIYKCSVCCQHTERTM